MIPFCQSCTAPLENTDFKGVSERYCKYCSDENGELNSREIIREGIAQWFKTWHGDVTDEMIYKRVDHFMDAMPAWADD